MTPSIQEKIKGELLVNLGMKQSLELLLKDIQTRIDACNAYESALSRGLETDPETSNPPDSLL